MNSGLLSLHVYTKLHPSSTGVCNYVVDGCGSGSIYMEGRERLSWIKSNHTVLTFPLIEMFTEDLVGYCLGGGTCEAGVFPPRLWSSR